ncbi:MAG: esterase-like activity of phytase family protein [Cyanobacteria bacterium P01_A01_bin.84]
MKLIKQKITPGLVLLFILILIITLVFNSFLTDAVEVTGIDFIGQAVLPTSFKFQETPFGGLSGITYDDSNQLYYSISDDRSQKAPARFYTLKINLSQGKLRNNGVEPVAVTTLRNKNSQTFANGKIDAEGIALFSQNTVFISSEGNADQLINPFIKEFSLTDGKELAALSISEKFLPNKNQKTGIRNNLAFETLAIAPDKKYLFTATENALIQDGSDAKPNQGTNCRILQYNLTTKELEKEFLYPTEPVKPFLSNISGKFASGLPDLVALDNKGNFISIERTFTGIGFNIALFKVKLADADDIHSIDSLSAVNLSNIKPVKKELLLDLRKLDVALDNIEGLTIGSQLPNGQKSLILVSDNNFNPLQRTQFLAFRLQTESNWMRLIRKITSFFNG